MNRIRLAAGAAVFAVLLFIIFGMAKPSLGKSRDRQGVMIGVSVASTSGEDGTMMRSILDHAARAMGAEIRYVEHNGVTQNIRDSFELLAESGCEAMILACDDEEAWSYAAEACASYGIYLALCFDAPDEEEQKELYDTLAASKYVIGAALASSDESRVLAEYKEQYCQALYAFMMAHHAVVSKNADYSGDFELITLKKPEVTTSEQAEAYQSAFVNSLPYDDRELEALSKLGIKKLRKEAEKLTPEDVLRRRS